MYQLGTLCIIMRFLMFLMGENIMENKLVTYMSISRIKYKNKKLRCTPEYLKSLETSMSEIGMLHPLLIDTRINLLAGRIRIEAAKNIKLKKVPVHFIKDLTCTLATSHENLMRYPLNSVERDIAMCQHKEYFEAKYPDTRRGVAGGKAKKGKAKQQSFSEDVASKTGMTTRSIHMSVARVKRASERVTKARTKNELNSSDVNELIKLNKESQDQLLPIININKFKDIRQLVRKVQELGIEGAVAHLKEEKDNKYKYELVKAIDKVLSVMKMIVAQENTIEIDSDLKKKVNLLKRTLAAFLKGEIIEPTPRPTVVRRPKQSDEYVNQ